MALETSWLEAAGCWACVPIAGLHCKGETDIGGKLWKPVREEPASLTERGELPSFPVQLPLRGEAASFLRS